MTLASSLAHFVLDRELDSCLEEQENSLEKRRSSFHYLPKQEDTRNLFLSILKAISEEDLTKVILPPALKQNLAASDWEIIFSAQRSALLLRIPRLFQQPEVSARTAEEVVLAYTTIFLNLWSQVRAGEQSAADASDEKLRFYYTELRNRENELQQLIRYAPDAVIVINSQGTITLWNPKAEEIFGWKATEVVGQPLSATIIPPEYRAAHAAGMQRFLATKEAHVLNQSIEITALDKTGREFPISLKISHYQQAEKDVFIAFLRNIEEQKKNEKELLRKRKELEQSNQELEQYAWLTSHDLREPLRKILTYSDLILSHEEQHVPESVKQKLKKISASAQRMGTLIKAMLTYSSITDEEQLYYSINLTDIVNEVLSDLELLVQESGAKIQMNELPVIEAIPHQMRQLFQNIISNAIKYQKPGVQPEIRISGHTLDANQVSVVVSDNGVGFEAKDADKVFLLFHRLHTLDKKPGSGIGLALCKKIVQNHGGSISVKSQPGTGTTFTIVLPFKHSY